jgi:Outer membrane protein beta-barrel domain
MKQGLAILFSLFFTQTLFCQANKWAIRAGYNYTSARASYAGVKQSVTAKSGFGLAVMAKIEFDGILHFSPYVGYNMKGFIINPKTGTIKKEEYTFHYFDIAPLLSVDLPVGENTFVISAGPILGITNFGSQKITTTNNVTTSEKIKFGYGSYGMFDLSLTGSLGYHFKKIFIEAAYTPGLANINNNEEFDGRNIRNRMLSLNIGYYFK